MKMKRYLLFFLTIITITFYSALNGQEADQYKLDEKIPFDPNIKIGKLDNGITYYIRKNHKPEKRAELRLAVNAGAVLEDDDQNGLAHFTEHMGFNGTKHFKKQELVNYLESIGMKFGPEVNAYTSSDETVYMLQLPTDTAEIFEKGFQVLEDWAHNVSFDDDEIDKERGVIIEEWRLGRGANARMSEKQRPVLYKGSKYAERNVIGKKEILESFKHETLKKFYKDWYRPDLMSVIAVGDFEIGTIEELIKKYFSGITYNGEKPERKLFPVPDHKQTYFAIASDKEAMYSVVYVYSMREVQQESTVGDFRQMIISNLYNGMLNKRFFELTQQADPPFIQAYSGKNNIVRTKSAYLLAALVKDNGIEKGLDALLKESERVRRFGFTQSELDRQKKETLRWLEQQFNERDKTESADFANTYVYNYLSGNHNPGIEYIFDTNKKLLPDIKLEEVNKLAADVLADSNRVVLVNSPQKDGVKIPSESELAEVFNGINSEKIIAYEDKVSGEDIMKEAPGSGDIINERHIDEIGVSELELSNGIKVILKPTDFKNDQIMFTGYSFGGSSLTSNENYISAATASSIINESGIGNFNSVELQKMLSGKVVEVYPWIGEIQEGLGGSASSQDIETMFKLIYLYFTAPRKDSVAFHSYLSRMNTYLQNRSAEPNSAFQDTLQVTLSNYHLRYKPWTIETLKDINLDKSIEFYKDRFADASDFTFIFVGNFDIEKIKPLLKTYLGGLPSIHKGENWKDIGRNYPKGVITKAVRKGIEPKSRVQINFTGDFVWNKQNYYDIDALTDLMSIKLREVVREDKSGTYGIGVWQSVSRYPKETYNITITFGCDPKRTDELTNIVFNQIDSLKNFGPEEKYITKVREQHIRTREVDLKQNDFWLGSLQDYYSNNLDPRGIIKYSKFFDTLSPSSMQKAAQKYLDMNNYVKVVLYPAETK
jgi:zinc protease